jgi:hypothetical protein
MSSTKRGSEREVSDYYKTPVPVIVDFLQQWAFDDFGGAFPFRAILDPCAGGVLCVEKMSYPEAIEQCISVFPRLLRINTVDIREDSPAEVHADYRMLPVPDGLWLCKGCIPPDLIITNPPFFLAQEIIEKALKDAAPNGYVVMLLRLNFFGGFKRLDFWQRHMPWRCYVHSKRIGFTDDGKTDSIEYMHCIWRKDVKPDATQLKILGGDVQSRRLTHAQSEPTNKGLETVANANERPALVLEAI